MTAEELQQIFANNLRNYRKLNDLTQMQLSEKADISVGYLCDLESGKKWGTPETISKLSNALKINPYQFFLNSSESKASFEKKQKLMTFSNNLKKLIDTEIYALMSE